MNEKGSDELLAEKADDPDELLRKAELEEARSVEEERRLTAMVVDAPQEPGHQYPDPDEAPPPAGAPDYDPLPPT